MIKVEITKYAGRITGICQSENEANALIALAEMKDAPLRKIEVPANDWTGQPAFTMWIVNEPEGFKFDRTPRTYGQGRKIGINND